MMPLAEVGRSECSSDEVETDWRGVEAALMESKMARKTSVPYIWGPSQHGA